MKIIFNKYGGLKTIENRQLLVQSSDNANYVDIYYQDDAGNFADETVNLATIAFKRSDSFEISERTCDAVREELTNKLLYFRYIFKEDELAINGELQITVRLKQVTFDPEDETQILLIKQRAMGKLVAHIYEAIGTDYEQYNVIDGRLLQLELWQSTFDGTYYDVTQIDAIVAQEVLNRNNAINDHDNNANAHASIREKIATNTANIATNDERISELEGFKDGLNLDIGNRINQAVAVETNAREQAIEDLQDIYVKKTDATKVEVSETNGNIKVDNEEVVVYDDTAVKQQITDDITTHNASELAHTFLKGKIDEAKAIAEGKSRARVFATESALDTWLLDSENVALLQIGDNLYIEELDKPDYWWNGTNKVKLETEKVDLTDYAKTTDLPTKVSDLENDSEFLTEEDLPTIPTIPDITVNNGSAEIGKYISQVAVDGTDKHKLIVTKADLPTGFSGNYDDLIGAPTIPTIPEISLNDDQATPGKYISKIEVDTTDKHKLNVTKETLPTGFSGDFEDLTNVPEEFPPSEHNHDTKYYKKSETYTKVQTDALVGNLTGETKELKSITTQPTGTFVYGDLYYNSSTKGMYYYTGSAWELTGLGAPIAGVIYSFNGTLYFWNETEVDLIQIGGGVDLSNYYTKTEIDTMRPTIELEVASLTTLTEAEKLAIRNTLDTLIVDDKIDGTKFDDIVLVTTNDLIRLHYSSIDYYVANPQITVIFETQSTKYILNVTVDDYTYSTLTSTTTYTKTEIDAMFDDLLGGSY